MKRSKITRQRWTWHRGAIFGLEYLVIGSLLHEIGQITVLMIVVWKLGNLQPSATTLVGACQPPNKDFCQTVPHHGNGRNSETKSQKIDPKAPKRPQRRGLQERVDKNRVFNKNPFFL